MTTTEYVYGYGRTKHIAMTMEGTGRSGKFGLCGAAGDYPTEEPDRPVCKRCERMAGKALRGEEPT